MGQRVEKFWSKMWKVIGIYLAIAGAMSMALWWFGRLWRCKLGDWRLYVGEAWNSSHTSQHPFDPYTFTHLLHGVAAFWIVNTLFKKISLTWKVALVASFEASWEILENSNFIIEKYRENTASLDYFGDTIINSNGDLLACVVGFIVATRLGMWRSFALFVITELILMLWIRDGLLLNILMLVYPIDAIRNWQMAI